MTSEVATTGTCQYDDGCNYTGEFDAEGRKHGFGVMTLPTGVVYSGGFVRGLPNGLGVMDFMDGEKYAGELMHGWFHGVGCYIQTDGMKYEGEFRGGRIWGKGLVSFPPGLFESMEGSFQGCQLLSKGECKETIERARKVAEMAKRLVK